ncbi:MAG: hypothetical protein SAL70_37040 [Scytonema sp. PMC 1070.18]|nr:hypothetical protein [Scytonema sp. PMC 1070.18]
MENKEPQKTAENQVSSDTKDKREKPLVDRKATDPQDDSEGTRSPGKTDRGI